MPPAIRPRDKGELSFIEKARRAQIVECAIETIASVGCARASLAQIAERAGISKGVISYHFAGKAELIEQVVHAVYAAAGSFMAPRVEHEPTVAGMLRAYIESNLQFMRSHRTHMLALIDIWANFRPRDGEPSPLAALHQTGLTHLEGLLAYGQEQGEFRRFAPRVMALVIRKAIDEVAYQIATQDDFDLDAYAHELVVLFDRATSRDE
jgi:TetR/AcrR family fatty acid metabolism transcriptional regulator